MNPVPMLLHPVPRGKPTSVFDANPELFSIWHPDLAEVAVRHTRQFELEQAESGNVYAVYVGSTLVGLTGWYRMTDCEAGLRWHGVLPCYRKLGISRRMISHICEILPPEISLLFEVTRNPASKAAFERCGFSVIRDAELIRRVVDHANYDIDGGGWALERMIVRNLA